MYWKIARTFAKLINILFLIFVCMKITFIYKNVFSDEKFALLGKNYDSNSVFYYDNNSFPYFINYNYDDFSIFDLLDKDKSVKGSKDEESNLFRKIVSHRLSLVYLHSIFFGEITKIINNLGVI